MTINTKEKQHKMRFIPKSHKNGVLFLHIFPILFNDLYDSGAPTLHPKIVNSSTEINKKSFRF